MTKRRREPTYHPFEFTARECRELCRALELASVHGTVAERRAYRLWLVLDSYTTPEKKT